MCHVIWVELWFSHGSAGNGRHSQCGLRGGQDRASCGPHEPGEPDRCFQLGCRISDPQSALVSNQLLPSPPFPLSLLPRPSVCESVCDRPFHFPSPLFRCPPPTSCLTSSILAALRAAGCAEASLRRLDEGPGSAGTGHSLSSLRYRSPPALLCVARAFCIL